MTQPDSSATCNHGAIDTWSGNLAGRLWACSECKVRFYPACRTCVDIGHRNVDHVRVARPSTMSCVAIIGTNVVFDYGSEEAARAAFDSLRRSEEMPA